MLCKNINKNKLTRTPTYKHTIRKQSQENSSINIDKKNYYSLKNII